MARNVYPNPIYYTFFKFFSFVLIAAIVVQFGVIYLLASNKLSPSIRLSNKKLLGEIAYTSTLNAASSGLNILTPRLGKVTDTKIRFNTGVNAAHLWSPDGRKVLTTNDVAGAYAYYDVARKIAVPVNFPGAQNPFVVGWLSNNELVYSDQDRIYILQIASKSTDLVCSSCYLPSSSGSVSSRTRRIIIQKQTDSASEVTTKAFVFDEKNRSETEIKLEGKNPSFDGNFAFDAEGEGVVFTYSVEMDTAPSPTGIRLATRSAVETAEEELLPQVETRVAIWDSRTKATELVNANLARAYSTSFSPNGKLIAMLGSFDQNGDDFVIVMKPDGTSVKTLGSRAYGYLPISISWSPDSNWIAYNGFDGELKAVSVDGRDNFVITDNGRDPAWNPKMD